MKNIIKTFALLVPALCLAGEVEIATIKIQRADDIEFAYGDANEIGELTYGVNSEGDASLRVGTADGTKIVRDPEALHLVQPRLLDPGEYSVGQVGNMTKQILFLGGTYSFFGTITGNTTNHWSTTLKQNDTERTLRIASVSEDIYITEVEYDIVQYYQTSLPAGWKDYNEGVSTRYVLGGITNALHRIRHNDDNDRIELRPGFLGQVGTEYDIIASSQVDLSASADGSTPGTRKCALVITNLRVYGVRKSSFEGRNLNVIDTSKFAVYVKESDGTYYNLGSYRSWTRTLHQVQDRWAYYPAAQDVNMDSHKLVLDSDGFNYVKGNDDLTAEIGNDFGKYMTFDRGTSEPAAMIREIQCTTNSVGADVVRLYVIKGFGTNIAVKYANTLYDTFTVRNDVVSLGDVQYKGRTLQCFELPVTNGASGFYKVVATVDETRPASITIHPDKIKFGSGEVELQLITINLGNQTYQVLGVAP